MRRSLPAAFTRVAASVEEAKRAIVAAVPASRREPAPLADSIASFDAAIGRAREAMHGWGGDDTQALRERTRRALEEAARRSDLLRREAPELDFESLVLVLGDVIAPLEELAEVEHALRRG